MGDRNVEVKAVAAADGKRCGTYWEAGANADCQVYSSSSSSLESESGSGSLSATESVK